MSNKKHVTLVVEYEADQELPDVILNQQVLGGRTVSASIFDEMAVSLERERLLQQAYDAMTGEDDNAVDEAIGEIESHFGWSEEESAT